MPQDIRHLDVSVISDVHLATLASKAKSLLKYLKSIHPKILVLNGDIIDSWRFSRNYFPKSHMKVIRQLLKMIEKGVQVVYITGNHDDVFRKFNIQRMGNFSIVNQYEMTIKGEKIWIFHGDVFDHIIHHSPRLAKFFAAAYGMLTAFNQMLNGILRFFGRGEAEIYKSMKERIEKDRNILTNFERSAANAALSKNVDVVICGHTHVPVDKTITTDKGTVRYLNCGDWVMNFTAAECLDGIWTLNYFQKEENDDPEEALDELYIPDKKQVYRSILEELSVASFL